MYKQLGFEDFQRPTTHDDILNAFAHDQRIGAEWLTRRRIAQLCGRKVTPTMITLIEDLVKSGAIRREVWQWPNGAQGYRYRLAANHE